MVREGVSLPLFDMARWSVGMYAFKVLRQGSEFERHVYLVDLQDPA